MLALSPFTKLGQLAHHLRAFLFMPSRQCFRDSSRPIAKAEPFYGLQPFSCCFVRVRLPTRRSQSSFIEAFCNFGHAVMASLSNFCDDRSQRSGSLIGPSTA